MNWYLVKLIFEMRNDTVHAVSQLAGQWRLIRADEVAWAHEKAVVMGRLEASGRFRQVGSVSGKFMAVGDIIHLGAFSDGEPIFTVAEEPTNPVPMFNRSDNRHRITQRLP